MLKRLYISNYALIDSLEIELDPGLTIITGETGAGKSILLGALSLLLGTRAATDKAKENGRKIIVEGTFNPTGYGLRDLFEANSLDWDEECVLLRREVSPAGRSRAFINDTPVTGALLAQVASRLVDIHSQHQNLLIGTRDFQLRMLDALADNSAERAAYSTTFREYVELRRHVEELLRARARGKENEEFIRFRLEQLRKLKPRAGEQADLERRQEILADSASLSETLAEGISLLSDRENSILSQLHRVRTALQGINLALFEDTGAQDETLTVPSRLENAVIELTDISETLADWLERVDSDPVELDRVENRLSALYDAQRRFNVSDEEALVELLGRLEGEYRSLRGEDSELPELEAKLKTLGRSLKQCAAELTATRQRAAEALSEQLTAMAAPLGMANLKLSVLLTQGKLTADGQDVPSFCCAFNKNQPLKPVEKIASGGEISRLMLCLKATVASRMQLPTIIFDEVDTGVSGDIAARMALLMSDIASSIQVLAITHLPQVAARGTAHLKVYKEDTEHSTYTRLRRLTMEERVAETARMLSGTEVDEAAVLNARSLLSHLL